MPMPNAVVRRAVSLAAVLAGLLLLPLLARAQSAGSEATIRQVATTPATADISERSDVPERQVIGSLIGELSTTDAGLRPYLGELGLDGQQIVIRQDGSRNSASVDQQGPSNYAAVVQIGTLNAATVTQQGTENAAGIVLDGNRNEVRLLQDGTGNRYLLGFRGNDLDLTGERMRVQRGSNNRLIEFGQNRIPLNVRQTGNGMEMIIQHYGGGQ